MRRTSLPSHSRYLATPLVQLSDRAGFLTNSFGFGLWNRIDVKPSIYDKQHKVAQQDIGRLDLLANRYYNDPFFWWVIADRNNIMFQESDMKVGQDIIIPALSAIRAAISKATS